MLGFTRTTAIAVTAMVAVAARADDDRVAVGEKGQRLAQLVARCEALGFGGAVLAARDGKVVAALGVGHADLEGKVPCTATTLFELASATKQFTGACVVHLAQHKKLDLDDPLTRHLPGVPASCAKITLRHLLQHTSGIPGDNSQGGGVELAAVLPSFLRGGPTHEPGTHWEYWNQGYALLSEVVARRGEASYVAYCRTALFEPAGMRSTRFTGDVAPTGAVVAIGRSTNGAPRSALDHPYGEYGFQYRGMGGAVSSVWDLWRWDRALHGTKVLSPTAKAALFAPGLNDYALGWFVRKLTADLTVQSHGGGVRGFRCEIRRYPEAGACVFVLSHHDGFDTHQLANVLEAELLDIPAPFKPVPAALAPDLAGRLVGRFADGKGVECEIALDGRATLVRIHWKGIGNEGPVTRAFLGVESSGRVVLYEWTESTPVELELGGAGPIAGFTLRGQRFKR